MKTLKIIMIEMYLQTQYYLNCAVLEYEYVEQTSTDSSGEVISKDLKSILEKNLFEQEIIWMQK